jgi:hypothetical protein
MKEPKSQHTTIRVTKEDHAALCEALVREAARQKRRLSMPEFVHIMLMEWLEAGLHKTEKLKPHLAKADT